MHACYTLRMIHPCPHKILFYHTGRPVLSHKTRVKKSQQLNNRSWWKYFLRGIFPANSMIFFCGKKKKLRKTHATFKILWNNCKMSKLYKLLCWDINTMDQILRLLPEPICWSFQQYIIWLQKITIWIDNNLMLLSCIIM